jgi:hypothetical protein
MHEDGAPVRAHIAEAVQFPVIVSGEQQRLVHVSVEISERMAMPCLRHCILIADELERRREQ